MHSCCSLLSLCLLGIFVSSSASTNHPGHLKSFGSSGPFDTIDQITDQFPDPIPFFEKYVVPSRPVLFRQVLNHEPHASLWNSDDKINEVFADSKDTVHIETQKKESRKQDILSMTMSEFLQRYQHEELYLVEEVPPLLR